MRYAIVLMITLLLFGCTVQTEETGASTPSEGGAAGAGDDTATGEETSSAGVEVTAAEVAKHSDSASCWVVYEGDVYDVTGFLFNHGGGPAVILSHCGKSDASFATAFEGQHNQTKVDTLKQESIYMGRLEK